MNLNNKIKINTVLTNAFDSVKEDIYCLWITIKKDHNKWFCLLVATLINIFIIIIGIVVAPFLLVLYIIFGLKLKPWEMFIGHI